jgi:hypothetical protein
VVNLINGYVVDVDPLNYTLKKATGGTDKQGNPTYRTYSYHGSLKQAIKACVSLIQKEKLDNGAFTLQEAIEVLNQSQKSFEELLDNTIHELEVDG